MLCHTFGWTRIKHFNRPIVVLHFILQVRKKGQFEVVVNAVSLVDSGGAGAGGGGSASNMAK